MDAVVQSLVDPIRREILRMLGHRPMNAGEIAAAFSVSRPAISRHLRVLREAGLVSDAPLGRERTYQRTLEVLAELEAFLAELRAPNVWEKRLRAACGESLPSSAGRGERICVVDSPLK